MLGLVAMMLLIAIFTSIPELDVTIWFLPSMAYEVQFGRHRIAPTRNCNHILKKFSYNFLSLSDYSLGGNNRNKTCHRRSRNSVWVQYQVNRTIYNLAFPEEVP